MNEDRKRDILQFIIAFKKRMQGDSPTLAEIMEACDIHSKSTAHRYLVWLEQDNMIERPAVNGRSRASRIIIPDSEWIYTNSYSSTSSSDSYAPPLEIEYAGA